MKTRTVSGKLDKYVQLPINRHRQAEIYTLAKGRGKAECFSENEICLLTNRSRLCLGPAKKMTYKTKFKTLPISNMCHLITGSLFSVQSVF